MSDGAFRAIQPALAHLLGLLGLDVPALATVDVENSRGDRVGVVRVARDDRLR